jgi:hypothetical protein
MREQSFLSYSLNHKNYVRDVTEITCVESENQETWNASGHQEQQTLFPCCQTFCMGPLQRSLCTSLLFIRRCSSLCGGSQDPAERGKSLLRLCNLLTAHPLFYGQSFLLRRDHNEPTKIELSRNVCFS